MDDLINKLIDELKSENERFYKYSIEHNDKVNKLIDELKSENECFYKYSIEHNDKVNKLISDIKNKSKLDDKRIQDNILQPNITRVNELTYERHRGIDTGKLETISLNAGNGRVENISRESIPHIANNQSKEKEAVHENTKNDISSDKEKSTKKYNGLLPDYFYDEYISSLNRDYKDMINLNVPIELRTRLECLEFEDWKNEKSLREHMHLVEEETNNNYCAKEIHYNKNTYYLLRYKHEDCTPLISRVVIDDALDIFFSFDVKAVLDGDTAIATFERPAILTKKTDGTYVLKEKGKIKIGR